VENVTWDGARSYCQAIGGRLPPESEWEYAARAGSTSARYGNLDDIAWYSDNSGDKTHEVGEKQANAFGLYDMLGNVWQRTVDSYMSYQSGCRAVSHRAGNQQGSGSSRRLVGIQSAARVSPNRGRSGRWQRKDWVPVRGGITPFYSFPFSILTARASGREKGGAAKIILRR
jgi:formylglycine-generating enzyme required for sulfatase activity